jgi:hypothetical protein
MDFKLSAMKPKSRSSSSNTVLGRTNRKSPTNMFHIGCFRCFVDSNEFIGADFEDISECGTVKRHQETAYYSVVADLNRKQIKVL